MSGDDAVKATGAGVKLTYDDFLLFPDDGLRHELIDGEHYVTPSPNTKHQRVSGSLHLMIGLWLRDHPIGQVFYAPFDVLFEVRCRGTRSALHVERSRAGGADTGACE